MKPWHHSSLLTLFEVIVERNRTVRQNALLWVLAISTEHQRPLGPMIEALAQEEGSRYWSARLRELVKHLNAGMPLPDALDRLPGLLPAHAVLAVRVGVETGTLPAMLKETAKGFSDQNDEVYSTWKGTLIYLATLLVVLLSVATFIMMFIIPKFKKIFQDFNTDLPELTKWIIAVADEIEQWLPMIALAGFLGLAWLAWRTRHGTNENGLLRRLLFSHARGQAPGVLRILSVVVGGGRPVVGAISTMARHHPSTAVRNHLLFLRNEIERGGEIWDDLADLGFLKPSESHILDAASRAGNLPWALSELAGSIERDVDYRTTYILEILRPAILVAIAVAVGVFAIGMFLPIIKLMNDLA